MATISEALAIALQHHQAGRLAAAEQIYRQILEVEPNEADALHLLGVAAHQSGRNEAAVESIERAIGLKANAAHFHNNLAKVYHALGRLPEAEAAARRALELRTDFAAAHDNLGNALREQGKLEEAVASFHRALELAPNLAEAHDNLGVALREQGKLEEAMGCFRRALELKPDLAEALNNLGNGLREQGKTDEAVDCFRRVLELKPDLAETCQNLGNGFREQGKLDEAVVCFRRALELKPDLVEALNSLAVSLSDQGKLTEAVACSRRALELEPGHAKARHNLALALLQLGRYAEGWPEYESRLVVTPPPDYAAPRWEPSAAGGGTILLCSEQGFGDTLQFVRYAGLMRERARAERVLLFCPQELARLLAASADGEYEVFAAAAGRQATVPVYDWHLPLLSLPLALGINDPRPMPRPYLRADPAERARWRTRLGPASELRVGFAWKGSAVHRRDHLRSMPWRTFRPLVSTPGLRFYSLQMGADGAEQAELAAAGAVDCAPWIGDFADTAALAEELDLIISVDTSIVHLAGGLGRPVWTLLPCAPDWRWGSAGDSTPWYPSMRLFRQPARGDWGAVVRRVMEEVGRWKNDQ